MEIFEGPLVAWAETEARSLLATTGDRWQHTEGVARQARRVASALPAQEGEVLVAAAYLHDVGYAPSLNATGFHPLDGARHVASRGMPRLAGLVAYHSGARSEAELRGLLAELGEFLEEASATAEALTYCDMTTGPAGEPVTVHERLTEVERRYGTEDVVSRSVRLAGNSIRAAVSRTEQRLSPTLPIR